MSDDSSKSVSTARFLDHVVELSEVDNIRELPFGWKELDALRKFLEKKDATLLVLASVDWLVSEGDVAYYCSCMLDHD